ncbi:MAG: HK97 family phage prohead protease [Clostridium fessum]
MIQPLLIPTAAEKRIDTDFYVEGYATTFDKPYLLYEWDGNKYYERIDRNALAGADMSDVIMQYNHEGKVLARLSNGTLGVEANDNGLFTFADLSKSRAAQDMFEEIKNGLVTKMSWAFRVSEDSYDRDTRTRTILKIAKVYDVSAVSIPGERRYRYFGTILFRRSDRKGTAGAAGTPEETFENQTNDGGLTQ